MPDPKQGIKISGSQRLKKPKEVLKGPKKQVTGDPVLDYHRKSGTKPVSGYYGPGNTMTHKRISKKK